MCVGFFLLKGRRVKFKVPGLVFFGKLLSGGRIFYADEMLTARQFFALQFNPDFLRILPSSFAGNIFSAMERLVWLSLIIRL